MSQGETFTAAACQGYWGALGMTREFCLCSLLSWSLLPSSPPGKPLQSPLPMEKSQHHVGNLPGAANHYGPNHPKPGSTTDMEQAQIPTPHNSFPWCLHRSSLSILSSSPFSPHPDHSAQPPKRPTQKSPRTSSKPRYSSGLPDASLPTQTSHAGRSLFPKCPFLLASAPTPLPPMGSTPHSHRRRVTEEPPRCICRSLPPHMGTRVKMLHNSGCPCSCVPLAHAGIVCVPGPTSDVTFFPKTTNPPLLAPTHHTSPQNSRGSTPQGAQPQPLHAAKPSAAADPLPALPLQSLRWGWGP